VKIPKMPFDQRDYTLAAGLILLSIGAGMYNVGAGLALPGLILVGVAIFGVR
jgi:hypothetical protein